MALVEAKDLRLTYREGGVEAVAPTSFALDGGEFVALVGPSGCGKSTLLRLVAGLVAPSGGSLHVSGRSPKDARRELHALAFVFQHAALLPWRTVEANVRLPLQLAGVPRAEQRERAAKMLELVGLADFAQALPRQLSGGMKMRASLARALAMQPSILLLDEPFGALDDITRLRLNEELLDLWERDRFTALFVTHNVAEAVFLGQRVLVMSRRPGRIVREIAVPFAYPRSNAMRAEAEFARLTGEVHRALQEANE